MYTAFEILMIAVLVVQPSLNVLYRNHIFHSYYIVHCAQKIFAKHGKKQVQYRNDILRYLGVGKKSFLRPESFYVESRKLTRITFRYFAFLRTELLNGAFTLQLQYYDGEFQFEKSVSETVLSERKVHWCATMPTVPLVKSVMFLIDLQRSAWR